jgi:hypothetical protein
MDLVFALTLYLSLPYAKAVAPIIVEEAKRYNVDPFLVAAVIRKESGFNSKACFRGSHGLMQVERQIMQQRSQGQSQASQAVRQKTQHTHWHQVDGLGQNPLQAA